MKKLFALILALLMLCACGMEEEPVIEEPQSEAEVSVPENPKEKNEEEAKPERIIYESKNELEKFEATDIDQIQLFNDNYAYVNGLNNQVILGELCKTTISGYNLETDEAEIFFCGEAYFDYITAPEKKVVVFLKSAHCPNIEEHKEFNKKVIECFLNERI